VTDENKDTEAASHPELVELQQVLKEQIDHFSALATEVESLLKRRDQSPSDAP
jgi:hypothetical protein